MSMRIAHLMSGIALPGGIGTYIRRVADAQRAAGHEVAMIDAVSADVIEREVQRLRPDVLHAHMHTDLSIARLVPMVRTIHGHSSYCPSGSKYLKNRQRPCERGYSVAGCLVSHFVNHCGSVRPAQLLEGFGRTRREQAFHREVHSIAISTYVRDQMIAAGLPEKLIDVLLLPAPTVAPWMPPPREGVPGFVFVGRLVPEKGPEWLLRSAARVRVPVQIDICGHGPLEQRLKSLADELAISEKVKFHGWVDESHVRELMLGARAVIFPSTWHEPAGLVTLEAAAFGRAVIGSRVGAIPEYAEKLGNVQLIDANDDDALVAAMTELAINDLVAATLGQAGRIAAVQDFRIENHVARLHLHYEAAIARHSKDIGSVCATVNTEEGSRD